MTSLEKFFTAATFDLDTMIEQIVVDEHGINAIAWFDSVPDRYKVSVIEIVVPVASTYIGRPLTARTTLELIAAMHAAIWKSLTPIPVPVPW